MNAEARRLWIAATLMLVLVISVLGATPALADDGTPPPDSIPAEVASPEASTDGAAPEVLAVDAAPTDPAPVDAPPTDAAPTDAAPTEVAPVEPALTTDPATAPVADESAASVDVLAEVPAGSEIVVLDASGDTVPLATTEATEIIATTDPMWCAAGTSSADSAHCVHANSVTELIPLLAGHVGAGTIYFPASYGTADVFLDGDNVNLLSLTDLIIQGGWDGSTSGTIHSAATTGFDTDFSVPVKIINWNGSLTLRDLTISGVSTEPALELKSEKNISLTNVHVDGNDSDGADLQNCHVGVSGCDGLFTGTVTVTASSFNDNGGDGLVIASGGIITLTGVLANDNGYSGARLDNTYAAAAQAVNVTSSQFNVNAQTNDEFVDQLGLQVFSKGVITLTNIAALGNQNGDADHDDGGGWLQNTAGTTAGVTLKGTNAFSDNEYGLGILSNGLVSLNNMHNNNNSNGSGVYIDNTTGSLGVTFTGTNEFKGNARGVYILSDGAVALNNITANYNGCPDTECGGVIIHNQTGLATSVTLTGVNIFRDNANRGVWITSNGTVILSNVLATGNGYGASSIESWGMDIDNSSGVLKLVTLTGTNFFGWDYAGGLRILTRGPIMLNSTRAESSQNGPGALLDNTLSGTAAPQKVTLTGTNNFPNNFEDGLDVLTYGAVAINNLTGNNNGNGGPGGGDGMGANINNYDPSGTAVAPNGVTLTGVNEFRDNTSTGLFINSKGNIAVSQINANNNQHSGAVLINNGGTGTVTITGYGQFNNNAQSGSDEFLSGLFIRSKGSVTLAKLNANNNGYYTGGPDYRSFGYGVYIKDDGLSAPIITLSGNNDLHNNKLSGLEIYNTGAISVSNVQADDNGYDDDDPLDDGNAYGYGAYLDNHLATGKVVTLLGDNGFHNNYSAGLYVISAGPITANNLDVAGNKHGEGAVFINTMGAATPQNVAIAGYGSFNDNFTNGLYIQSYGAITLANIDANNNGWNCSGDPCVPSVVPVYGAWIDNYISGIITPKPVTLTGYGTFSDNAGGGLDIDSLGLITLASVTADNNHTYGAHINNDHGSLANGVTITANLYSSKNGTYGLEIDSHGAILINVTDAYAEQNGTFAWDIDNHNGTGGVTLSSVNVENAFDFDQNGTYGLQVQTRGSILIAGLDAYQSHSEYGAHLYNAYPGSVGTVSITGPVNGTNYFYNNAGDGLWVESNGLITIGNLVAEGNRDIGAELNNSVNGIGGVTLTGFGSFQGNTTGGLKISSKGAITLANISANGNVGYGARLNNTFGTTAGIIMTATTGGDPANRFNDNGWDCSGDPCVPITDGYGLFATSNGAITISNLRARRNSGFGASLDNRTGNGAITLTGTGIITENGLDGLIIMSKGAVITAELDAERNGHYDPGSDTYFGRGVFIDNSAATLPANVTLNGPNNLRENWLSGLIVVSKGIIALNNVNADHNGRYDNENDPDSSNVFGYGVSLDNCADTGGGCTGDKKAVNVTGSNWFGLNWNHGLCVVSDGPVSLLNASGDDNLNGASITNGFDTAFPQNVTVTNVDFNNQWWNGLIVSSFGTITLTNVHLSDNGWNGGGGFGASLDNCAQVGDNCLAVSPRAVILNGSDFNHNNGAGLIIKSLGTITLNSVNASDNHDLGAILMNQFTPPAPFLPGAVNATGTNEFSGNWLDGLVIDTYGAMVLNNITANWNGRSGYSPDRGGVNGAGGAGASLDNCDPDGFGDCQAPLVSNITLTGLNYFIGNHNDGLLFQSRGNVLLNNITADTNNDDKDNHTTGSGVSGKALGNITISCGSMTFNGNPDAISGYGYDLGAGGTIILRGVFAYGNRNGNQASPSATIVWECP